MATYVSAEFTYQNIVMFDTVVSGVGSTANTLYSCPANTFARVFPLGIKVNSLSPILTNFDYNFYLTSGATTIKTVQVALTAATGVFEAGGFNIAPWNGTSGGATFDSTLYNQGIPLFPSMTFSGIQNTVGLTFNANIYFGVYEIGKSA